MNKVESSHHVALERNRFVFSGNRDCHQRQVKKVVKFCPRPTPTKVVIREQRPTFHFFSTPQREVHHHHHHSSHPTSIDHTATSIDHAVTVALTIAMIAFFAIVVAIPLIAGLASMASTITLGTAGIVIVGGGIGGIVYYNQ